MSSISSVSSGTDIFQSAVQPNNKQIKNDFKALATALQSGNLSDAQQAYATLQKDAPNLFNSNSSSSQAGAQNNPLAAIGTALQAGDITSAQTAFSTLQQSQKTGGHHHHHHAKPAASAAAADTTSTTNPSGTTGTQINTSA
jgi:hypothetical protein